METWADFEGFALTIFDDPEKVAKISCRRALRIARLTLERELGFPEKKYTEILSEDIYFLGEVLKECDRLSAIALRTKES